MEEGEKPDMVPGTKVRGVDMTEQGNHEEWVGEGRSQAGLVLYSVGSCGDWDFGGVRF